MAVQRIGAKSAGQVHGQSVGQPAAGRQRHHGAQLQPRLPRRPVQHRRPSPLQDRQVVQESAAL